MSFLQWPKFFATTKSERGNSVAKDNTGVEVCEDSECPICYPVKQAVPLAAVEPIYNYSVTGVTEIPATPQNLGADNVVHAENVTINNYYTTPDEDIAEYQDEVASFADKMQARLDEKNGQPGKTGWGKDHDSDLFSRFYEKAFYLKGALQNGASKELIAEYAVDAANYLMMLADNAGAL